MLHSLVRWLVVIVAVIAVVRYALVMAGKAQTQRDGSRPDVGLHRPAGFERAVGRDPDHRAVRSAPGRCRCGSSMP